MIGSTISNYKILEKLGEGGMGVVYKAQDTRLDRIVALKFLSNKISIDEEEKNRFINEAKAASSIEHNNICNIHSIEETDDGQLYIVMAYYKGASLQERIGRQPLPLEEFLNYAIQIAGGLEKAHKNNIIHRDLKPGNIVITEDDVAKIIDFGLAKAARHSLHTSPGTTMGTAAYMSPEQAQGSRVDHRTDIWSLGVLMYEMIAGQRPFKSEYETALIYSILNEEPAPLTELRSNVPMEIERIVSKCLEKDPGERYQQINELIVDLKKIYKGITAQRTIQKQPVTKPGKSTKKPIAGIESKTFIRPALYIISSVLVLIIALYYFSSGKNMGDERKPSIAVLPFENLSPAPDDAYFADGVHENIIIHLSKIAGMSVTARSSVMPFKPGERDIENIAENLGATAILEGNVRRAENTIRVSVQLIDPFNNQMMWADIYDRKVTDVFAIQSEIARNIADALKIQITAEEDRAIDRAFTDNLDAYRLYLQGRALLGPRQEQTMRQAVTLFQRALVMDTEFAAAWAGLADALTYLETFGFESPDMNITAERAAERALELDPGLAEAHFALSNIAHANRNDSEAISRSERAIELRPSYSDAYNLLSWIHKLHGNVEDALKTAEKAVEFDPLGSAPQSNMALGSLAEGNHQKALSEAQIIQQLHPGFSTGIFIEALALYHLGEFSQVKALLHNVSVDWAPSGTEATLALAEIALGNNEAAIEILESLDSENHPFSVALIHAEMGEAEIANRIISSIEEWDYWPTLAMRYFFPDTLKPLRTTPEYRQILTRINQSWGNSPVL